MHRPPEASDRVRGTDDHPRRCSFRSYGLLSEPRKVTLGIPYLAINSFVRDSPNVNQSRSNETKIYNVEFVYTFRHEHLVRLNSSRLATTDIYFPQDVSLAPMDPRNRVIRSGVSIVAVPGNLSRDSIAALSEKKKRKRRNCQHGHTLLGSFFEFRGVDRATLGSSRIRVRSVSTVRGAATAEGREVSTFTSFDGVYLDCRGPFTRPGIMDARRTSKDAVGNSAPYLSV